MDKAEFAKRLAELRIGKGVSARDMSLSIGQSASYINNIENGVNLPSMTCFFFICEYLGVSEAEFFDLENRSPLRLHELVDQAMKLDSEKLGHLVAIVSSMK